jgi:hypothetical protein
MTQLVNLTHTEQDHNGLVLSVFGIAECRLTLRRV